MAADDALAHWLRRVYGPIDRLLGEVINPFPAQLKALSADPYDDIAIVQSMKPDRHNPVKKMQEKYGMSEALRERKQWRPNSFRKSKMTPSTACMGINKHKI